MERVPSSYGHQEMVAVSLTRVIVMGTPTVSSPCPSVVCPRRGDDHGT